MSDTRLEPVLIETDENCVMEFPGHPNERFMMVENEDGSIALIPEVHAPFSS